MRYFFLCAALAVCVVGCDSGTASSVSANDIEIVTVTPVTGEFGPAYRVTLRNGTGRTVSVTGEISAVDGDEVLDTGVFIAEDLRDGQQSTDTADLFDLESFAGVDCYQYRLIVVAAEGFGSDSRSYRGTCG